MLKSLVFEGLGDGFLSIGIGVVVVVWRELVDIALLSVKGKVNALRRDIDIYGLSNHICQLMSTLCTSFKIHRIKK